VLGEDQLPVDLDVELTRLPDDQRGVDADLLLDLGRETRGAGFVVSDVAVLDPDGGDHAARLATPPPGGKARLGHFVRPGRPRTPV
jgi:hypothetical protein